MRVFLTGGTGLIGSHVAALLRSRGDEVVALQRESAETAFLESLGCEVRPGNVRDRPGTIAEAAAGCQAAVHAAALVYAHDPWPRLRAVNVEGTENVLRGAAEAGIRHAVYISSVAVYGPLSGPVDEDAPLDSPLRPKQLYARSKREAEAVARELDKTGVIGVTILRPAAVYGERDRLFAPMLERVLRFPVVPLLGNGRNTLPVVYAGNVAAGVLAALSGRGMGRAFNLAFDYPLSQRELLEGLARALGRQPRFITVPAWLVGAIARAGDALGAAVPGAAELPLRRIARLGLGENPYRSERARLELGWHPPCTHDDALVRTAAWLREWITAGRGNSGSPEPEG
ncbi:MAG: NAD-dependent epimerase/dehydratase family protein [Gemmatimonadetes bacterium]|nr:NAD-dependent epimerase/dehydratase family protein [Gemmatimonadota bacterium]